MDVGEIKMEQDQFDLQSWSTQNGIKIGTLYFLRKESISSKDDLEKLTENDIKEFDISRTQMNVLAKAVKRLSVTDDDEVDGDTIALDGGNGLGHGYHAFDNMHHGQKEDEEKEMEDDKKKQGIEEEEEAREEEIKSKDNKKDNFKNEDGEEDKKEKEHEKEKDEEMKEIQSRNKKVEDDWRDEMEKEKYADHDQDIKPQKGVPKEYQDTMKGQEKSPVIYAVNNDMSNNAIRFLETRLLPEADNGSTLTAHAAIKRNVASSARKAKRSKSQGKTQDSILFLLVLICNQQSWHSYFSAAAGQVFFFLWVKQD